MPLKAPCGSSNVQVERSNKSLLNEFKGQILYVLLYYSRICILVKTNVIFFMTIFKKIIGIVWTWAFLHFSKSVRLSNTVVLKAVSTTTSLVNSKFSIVSTDFLKQTYKTRKIREKSSHPLAVRHWLINDVYLLYVFQLYLWLYISTFNIWKVYRNSK